MRTNEAVLHEGPSIELDLYSFLIEVRFGLPLQ